MSTHDDALARAREISDRGRAEILALTGTGELAAEEWRRRNQQRDDRTAIVAAAPGAFSNRPTTPRPTWALHVAKENATPAQSSGIDAARDRASFLREQQQARAAYTAQDGGEGVAQGGDFWTRHLRPAPHPAGRMPTFDIVE